MITSVVVTEIDPVLFPTTDRRLTGKGSPTVLTSRSLGLRPRPVTVRTTVSPAVLQTPMVLTALGETNLTLILVTVTTRLHSRLSPPVESRPELPIGRKGSLVGRTMVVVIIGLVNGFSLILLTFVTVSWLPVPSLLLKVTTRTRCLPKVRLSRQPCLYDPTVVRMFPWELVWTAAYCGLLNDWTLRNRLPTVVTSNGPPTLSSFS